MDSRSFTMPKGEYFFGDLCQLFPHPDDYPANKNKDWIDIFCENDEGDWDYMGKDYLLFSTNGDGNFLNYRGNNKTVKVDSGSLGLISTDVVDQSILKEVISIGDCGFIYTSEHEIKVDIQGDADYNHGLHIYPKRNNFVPEDDSILIVISEDEFDEDYFISRCPSFQEGQKKTLMTLNEDSSEEDAEDEDYDDALVHTVRDEQLFNFIRETITDLDDKIFEQIKKSGIMTAEQFEDAYLDSCYSSNIKAEFTKTMLESYYPQEVETLRSLCLPGKDVDWEGIWNNELCNNYFIIGNHFFSKNF